MIINVLQKITGLDAATALSSEGFQSSFIGTVADILKVPPTSITITSITDDFALRRMLAAAANSTGIIVNYNVQDKNLDAKTIQSVIAGAVSSGQFNDDLATHLADANVTDITASALVMPLMVDLSPTGKPSARPTPSVSYAPSAPPTLELSQVVNGVTAREAKKYKFFKSDFSAVVATIVGGIAQADSVIIMNMTDVVMKKGRALLVSSITVTYLVPVQNSSASTAFNALVTASNSGAFANSLNRKLTGHNVPFKVSVDAPIMTERNPTSFPTLSPIIQDQMHPISGMSVTTIGLIAGFMSMACILFIIFGFFLFVHCSKLQKRR